ncbi:GNAT family N-acetyltransferase [Spirosoma sp. KNUC1025]|uniref:GNAT family N-acetyltransferase n=1 Tax=Spirosoma sp. KNUC1025 TaxID=2894082 RepID=UPI00386CD34C|nr:GNAT family N-acetyltransferase [Spirosoma sp. KNUC1025]
MNYQAELDQAAPNAQTYRLLLFDNQNQPIGYARGEFRQYAMWYDGQLHFFLYELVVSDQTHRQQGLGNQLLKAVEAFARTKGACWIRGQMGQKTSSYTDNATDETAATNFWGNNGYGIKREIYDDSIRFWKPLQRTRQPGQMTAAKFA